MNKMTEKTFWSNCDTSGECWNYRLSSLDRDGYGQVHYQNKYWRANRLAWHFANGPIPAGYCVLHRCDNPSCCRPEHLWLGTRADNNRDMVNKSRNRNQKTGRRPERMHIKR